GIAPLARALDPGPPVLAIGDEMAPARMERHLQRRIGLTGNPDHQIGGVVQSVENDMEMLELAGKPQRQHRVRAFAHRLRAQKPRGCCRWWPHLDVPSLRSRTQLLSRSRPMVPAGSRASAVGAL